MATSRVSVLCDECRKVWIDVSEQHRADLEQQGMGIRDALALCSDLCRDHRNLRWRLEAQQEAEHRSHVWMLQREREEARCAAMLASMRTTGRLEDSPPGDWSGMEPRHTILSAAQAREHVDPIPGWAQAIADLGLEMPPSR